MILTTLLFILPKRLFIIKKVEFHRVGHSWTSFDLEFLLAAQHEFNFVVVFGLEWKKSKFCDMFR